MSTNRIQKMIQKAHRDGQSVDDLLSEIDMGQVNTSDEPTPDLVRRLAAEQGLGW